MRAMKNRANSIESNTDARAGAFGNFRPVMTQQRFDITPVNASPHGIRKNSLKRPFVPRHLSIVSLIATAVNSLNRFGNEDERKAQRRKGETGGLEHESTRIFPNGNRIDLNSCTFVKIRVDSCSNFDLFSPSPPFAS
jgi:hypothetical protein